MEAMCSFCRFCLDDSGSGFTTRRRVGGEDSPYGWECVDADACRRRMYQNRMEELIDRRAEEVSDERR